ncbi:SAM-dependent methyltransferase [Saccharothrix tamanrassetensis]|uniref:SAM-dependent methyltransferase n=1 Tax=Saccharothrix tamanrassetensis TaxID=1051531 RepID=A0A841C9A7_9PSEU|nr:class I SAM-dependent methyltransferase [Saccharothrix tamanrassetensis]MBB5953540.1 SAM-dependent methyltransferase [Saccharothrix tamanrassetensis]
MSVDDVRDAYGRRAEEYTDLFGSQEAVHELDRELVSRWAGEVSGRMIDAGCGPGQWTDFLRRQGCDVEGVDLVPRFVGIARSRFPGNSFRVAELDDLGVPDRSVAGILSWYSIIHTGPDDVPRILGEFARCLCDGGSLLLGMFEGARVEPFPHAVTTAYFWSVEEMSRRLVDAGFRVEATESRVDPGQRPHAAIVARRVGGNR